MKRGIVLILIFAGLVVLVFSGCSGPQAVVVYQEPPAAIYRVPGGCVGSGWIWVRGHWAWQARRSVYEWVSGKCVKRRAGKQWVHGYWRKHGNGWIWVEGFWD